MDFFEPIKPVITPTVFTGIGIFLTKIYERWSKNKINHRDELAEFRKELLLREQYLTELLAKERENYEKRIKMLQVEIDELQDENEALRKTQLAFLHEIGELKLQLKMYITEKNNENPPTSA
jgi:hypothetical protein